jgi:hypothetical protein
LIVRESTCQAPHNVLQSCKIICKKRARYNPMMVSRTMKVLEAVMLTNVTSQTSTKLVHNNDNATLQSLSKLYNVSPVPPWHRGVGYTVYSGCDHHMFIPWSHSINTGCDTKIKTLRLLETPCIFRSDCWAVPKTCVTTANTMPTPCVDSAAVLCICE